MYTRHMTAHGVERSLRALVAARYAEARRRGGPGVVVQAGHMSEPILERLGFRKIDTLAALRDSSQPS